MADLTSAEMSEFGLEQSDAKPASTEKPAEKPVEQKKPGEGARSLAGKIASWFKKSPSNPDAALWEIANLPLDKPVEAPKQPVQAEPLPANKVAVEASPGTPIKVEPSLVEEKVTQKPQEVPAEAPVLQVKIEEDKTPVPQTTETAQADKENDLGEEKVDTAVTKVEEVVDLSPENIAKSQQEYIAWRRSQYEEPIPSELDKDRMINNEGSYTAVEPGRANIFCHASTLEGAINILSSGAIKSARKILLDDNSLAHAPQNRGRQPSEAMVKGKTFSQMTPEEQRESLSYAQTYVAGTLGVAVLGYTVEGSPDSAGMFSNEKNLDTQTAVVFPLQTLKEKGLRFEKHFNNSHPEDISPKNIEFVEMNLKYLPTNAKYSDESQGSGGATMEINFDNLNEAGERVPGQIDLDGSVLLVRENKVDEISQQVKERMLAQGKSQQEIEDGLRKIVGFSSEFMSVDEAVGWLSNSPVGKALVAERTGTHIDQIPVAKLRPESEYVRDFIGNNQEEISNLERKRKIEEEEATKFEESLKEPSLSDDDKEYYEIKLKRGRDSMRYFDASIRFQNKIGKGLEEALIKLSGKAN